MSAVRISWYYYFQNALRRKDSFLSLFTTYLGRHSHEPVLHAWLLPRCSFSEVVPLNTFIFITKPNLRFKDGKFLFYCFFSLFFFLVFCQMEKSWSFTSGGKIMDVHLFFIALHLLHFCDQIFNASLADYRDNYCLNQYNSFFNKACRKTISHFTLKISWRSCNLRH